MSGRTHNHEHGNASHSAMQAQAGDIAVKHDTGMDNIPQPLTVMKETKFFFKTAEVKDEALGEVTKVKRPTVTLELPVPTLSGVVTALHDEKQRDYILGLIADAVADAARTQVNDDVKPVNKQEELDVSKLTLEYLANEPKSERTGRGIAKEVWEAFSKDYISIMPALINRSAEQVGNAALLFVKKLQPCKTNKVVLSKLKEYLDTWFQASQSAEEFAGIYEFLSAKVDTFLNAKDEDLLNNL
jgi:hypothetical protein